MKNRKIFRVYLGMMILLLFPSCTDSEKFIEKTDVNIGSTSANASIIVKKSATEAERSTPVPQKEMTITPTPTEYPLTSPYEGWCYWLISQENPLDELNLRIQDGYTEIFNIIYEDGVWVATFIRHDDYSDSIHFYENLDREQIEELILSGNKVKIICPGEGGWLVVTTKDSNFLDQKLVFLSEFNLDEINKFIADGYWVTELRYWEKQWVVVLTETTDILDQKIEMISDIGPNRSQIDITDSYFYTSIVYDGQQWFVVRSKMKEYSTQSLLINDVFQKDTVQQFGRFGGYDNIKLYYVNDQWIYVFTK